jgi:hypothetical protein
VKHFVAAILGCWLVVFSARPAAPGNDNFADRFILQGSSIVFTGTLVGATRQSYVANPEAFERDFTGYCYFMPLYTVEGTVWWEWTAPASTTGIVEVVNSSTNSFRKSFLMVLKGTNFIVSDYDYFDEREQFMGGTLVDSGRRSFVQFAAEAGEKYQIQVAGDDGSFTLQLTATNAPYFLIHPVTQSASVSNHAFFGGLAVGPEPIRYQWRFNGVDLPGQNRPILSVNHLTTNQTGDYTLVASNSYGVASSTPAQLFVTTSDIQPTLTLRIQNDRYLLGIRGETGRMYQIESSTDLMTWVREASFPYSSNYYYDQDRRTSVVFNTNGMTQFVTPATSQPKFFRALRYDPVDNECHNFMNQYRFAKELGTLMQHENSYWGFPTPEGVAPFLGLVPEYCPRGGSYTCNATRTPVTCSHPGHFDFFAQVPEY